jgi:hypothetical protein
VWYPEAVDGGGVSSESKESVSWGRCIGGITWRRYLEVTGVKPKVDALDGVGDRLYGSTGDEPL